MFTQTFVSEWSHVLGKENPAAIASRGCSPENLSKLIWFKGPEFSQKQGSFDHSPLYYPISNDEENVCKNAVCQAVNFSEDIYSTLLSYISAYTRLIPVVARIWK